MRKRDDIHERKGTYNALYGGLVKPVHSCSKERLCFRRELLKAAARCPLRQVAQRVDCLHWEVSWGGDNLADSADGLDHMKVLFVLAFCQVDPVRDAHQSRSEGAEKTVIMRTIRYFEAGCSQFDVIGEIVGCLENRREELLRGVELDRLILLHYVLVECLVEGAAVHPPPIAIVRKHEHLTLPCSIE